jgi:hypothetical protein
MRSSPRAYQRQNLRLKFVLSLHISHCARFQVEILCIRMLENSYPSF